MKRTLLALMAVLFTASLCAQNINVKTYKFSKQFIESHYQKDSAFGTLGASEVSPAKNLHTIGCGGNDGELHIGIEGQHITNAGEHAFSALADEDQGTFGVVAEPVNLTSATQKSAAALNGQSAEFTGYFRIWNEGHDQGAVHPSNPHHVLELHPVWAFKGAGEEFDDASSVRPMQKGTGTIYRGYGASKFKPILGALDDEQWLHVYEDENFVFIELPKAENFYQLPIEIKSSHEITGGVEAVADVFSDAAHKNLVLSDLRVVANDGTRIAKRIRANEKIGFLLGLFSVNLRQAMDAAAGHNGADNAVFAPTALEFFAYGVPLETAVTSSKCNEEDD